jgi:hypothetical protein
VKDGSIFSVENITDDNGRVKIVGCEYLYGNPLFETPKGSAITRRVEFKIRNFNDIDARLCS